MCLKNNSLSFWNSISILITKPHVVNKRLWGCIKLLQIKCKPLGDNWEKKLANFTLAMGESITILEDLINEVPIQPVEDENESVEIIVVELLPKVYNDKHAYQLICLKYIENVVTFYNVTPEDFKQTLCPSFPYAFKFKDNTISLDVFDAIELKSVAWINKTVLPQIIKWICEDNTGPKPICSESLSLISKGKYYEKYNNLKLKYGIDMVKMWPESTDPLKFVYEDVAIATYLLLLWENKENKCKPKTFVDIGCGNGLLVYILTMEGHNGYGVDVRKRKIWDMYPKNIVLKEHTVDPCELDLYSDSDWIIGNHSDELTPWIPIIAAKSSYTCNFFLLPCCAFNFDGTKYQRKNTSVSQYNDYLIYINEVCEKLGFEIKMDRLKIPSTKRICFVSSSRTYSEDEFYLQLDYMQTFIYQEMGIAGGTETCDVKIKLRETTEKVRNCTQLDKSVISVIISQITNYLLRGINGKSEWSAGRTAKLSELVTLLSTSTLKILKSECGGLQTLLKNNHHIFEVQNGNVKLRYPRTIEEVKNKLNKNNPNIKMQVNKCWFYHNHPQGCPLNSDICSYRHEKTSIL